MKNIIAFFCLFLIVVFAIWWIIPKHQDIYELDNIEAIIADYNTLKDVEKVIDEIVLPSSKYLKIKGFYIGMSGEEALALVDSLYSTIFEPLQITVDSIQYADRTYPPSTLSLLDSFDSVIDLRERVQHIRKSEECASCKTIEFRGPVLFNNGIYWGEIHAWETNSGGSTMLSDEFIPNIALDGHGKVTSYTFTFQECEMLFGVKLDTMTGERSEWESFIRTFMNSYDIPNMDFKPTPLSLFGIHGEYSYVSPEGIRISIDTMYDRLIVEKSINQDDTLFN